MDIGETIDFLRTQKNLKVSEVTTDYISRQAYYNFVHGKTHTSINSFDIMLNNLCVSYDEFVFIKNGYSLPEQDALLLEMKKTFEQKDSEKLIEMSKYCLSKSSKTHTHLGYLCLLLKNRLDESSDTVTSSKLKAYLLSVATWTHYEIVLFNNSIYCFDTDTILTLMRRVMLNLEKYKSQKAFGSECFRMQVNVIITLLQRKDLNNCYRLFDDLFDMSLPQDALYERNILLFMKGLFEVIKNREVENKQVSTSLAIMETLGCTDSFNMFTSLYTYTINELIQPNRN